MKKFLVISSVMFVLSFNGQTNTENTISEIPQRKSKLSQEELSHLDSLDIHMQILGNCYALSSDKNKVASNGEAHSGNFPKPTDENFPKNNFYLLINQNEHIKYDNRTYGEQKLGCKLYLVNTSDSSISLEAQDSRLSIVAEALDSSGNWAPIVYNPSSWCGNSYHRVLLDTNEFWEFQIPVFKGSYKTKLRYSLVLDNGTKISSNEIPACINKTQLNPVRTKDY